VGKVLVIVLVVVMVIGSIAVLIYANPTVAMSLRDEIAGLEEANNSYRDEIARLNTSIENMRVSEVEIITSLQSVDGGLGYEFVRVEDKIVFPNRLALPGASIDVSNSNMVVGSRFRFIPSNNWVARMGGSTLELSHPAKMWGSVRAVTLRDRVANADMQPLLRNFFVGFPTTTIQYRNIHLGDTLAGLLASADISVSGVAHRVIVGFIQRGENAVLLLFVYENDSTGVQAELIDSFITSGFFGDSRIRLE